MIWYTVWQGIYAETKRHFTWALLVNLWLLYHAKREFTWSAVFFWNKKQTKKKVKKKAQKWTRNAENIFLLLVKATIFILLYLTRTITLYCWPVITFAKKYPKNNREKRIRFQKRDTSATTRVHQVLRVTTEKNGCSVI